MFSSDFFSTNFVIFNKKDVKLLETFWVFKCIFQLILLSPQNFLFQIFIIVKLKNKHEYLKINLNLNLKYEERFIYYALKGKQ
jgi:hypothetical protein